MTIHSGVIAGGPTRGCGSGYRETPLTTVHSDQCIDVPLTLMHHRRAERTEVSEHDGGPPSWARQIRHRRAWGRPSNGGLR